MVELVVVGAPLDVVDLVAGARALDIAMDAVVASTAIVAVTASVTGTMLLDAAVVKLVVVGGALDVVDLVAGARG